jgi:hypothetical protein
LVGFILRVLPKIASSEPADAVACVLAFDGIL